MNIMLFLQVLKQEKLKNLKNKNRLNLKFKYIFKFGLKYLLFKYIKLFNLINYNFKYLFN